MDTMNEEQAVLDFFAKEENLPLGLSVAEQVDKLREQLNNRLWPELQQRIDTLINTDGQAWLVELTEDKNAADTLVGLHCTMSPVQPIYLLPMMEQQYLGGEWRIYFGLMWSTAPSPDHLGLPAVKSLKEFLQQAGFKNNASFLGWQWATFRPRRKEFLLRYIRQPEIVLADMEAVLKKLLAEHHELLTQANTELRTAPYSVAISLAQLRSKRSTD